MIIISDTSPICYLLLIGEIELLPQLYGQVLIPTTVQQELADRRSPDVVREWINNPPNWLIIENVNDSDDPELEVLDAGEKAAIMLAEDRGASLVIIDDGVGRRIARARGLRVTGIIGVLNNGAQQNMINFPDAICRLQQTTFFVPEKLIQSLLSQYQ
ncbi:MAG: DUF3368 domain-containing protein [Hormoscilla sp.]